MKKLIKNFLNFIFNPKYEKFILILLPTIVLIVSGIIISPAVKTITSNTKITEEESKNDNSIKHEEQAIITENVKETIKPTSNIITSIIETHLTAISTENDLYIFVRNSENKPITSDIFTLHIKYPDGQISKFKTSSDGGCYLVNLTSGNYTISMEEKDGYSLPEEITCSVKNKISYSAIENIEDIVDVKDISEVANEVKSNGSEAPTEIVAEIINTSNEPSNNEGSIIYDDNGNIIYTYQYSLSPDGFFYDSTGNVTDVKPQLENDILIGGLRKKSDYEYESVVLFNSDNTPLSNYAITATPKSSTTTSTLGWQTINDKIYYILEDGSKAVGLKNIDGKTYYFNCNGEKASSIGVDVSFYNGTINWSAVKNAGIDFAIIRVGGRGWGTGVLYDDSCFYNYLKGAKAAGLKVGIYFYSTATNRVEAVQEASIALERLNGAVLDFPIYIDMELSGEYPTGRSDNLSVAERVEIVQAFCETIKNSNYKAGLYTGEYFLSNYLNYQQISQYNIWMASYTENNALPKTQNRYDIWQFTDRGRINGINGNADLNVIF